MTFNFTAVIFDMDGTLFDTEKLCSQCEIRACAEMGYTMTPEIYLGTVGLPSHGERGWRAFLLGHYGPDFPIDEVARRTRRYMNVEIAQNGLPIKPGASELLDWLDANHIPRAIASSSARESIAHHLERVGWTNRIDLFVGGDEIAHGKPAPDIFLEAARRLSVSPLQCAAFEDSEAGVRSAHAAAMYVIMIPDLKLPSDEVRALANHVLPSLNEARLLLSSELRIKN